MELQHPRRYIFETTGVCPPEIHFDLTDTNTIQNVRFVGGGCPGNAALVGRLLEGRAVEDILAGLSGIDCRNHTSCPDQLARALKAAVREELHPAESFRLAVDATPRRKIGLIGDLDGNPAALAALRKAMAADELETVYCIGNLTAESGAGNADNEALLRWVHKHNIAALAGQRDWVYAGNTSNGAENAISARGRDILLRLPQVQQFQMGEQIGMAFYGEYLQDLPAYSDFAPFALEMNMVCNLSNFMQDTCVFPALEAMTPQFTAQVVVFAQPRRWQQHTVGDVLFVGAGPACVDNILSWGVLEQCPEGVIFTTRTIPFEPE